MNKPIYHSRHIPIEHVLTSVPMGQIVKDNGLCDVLTNPVYVNALKDYGIENIETRLVWTELEPEPGRYVWDRLDRDIALIEKHGFGVGIFPWFQHPPGWEKEMTRCRCLEHGEDSTIPSLWDPALLRTYDRLYGALAQRYGERIRFVYVGVYSDYGEVLYPLGVKHYYFSPPHNHSGFWCSDVLARKDFAQQMATRYETLDSLNDAWGTAFKSWDDDLMPCLPIESNPLRRRMDFGQWYTSSLLRYTDAVCALVRKHFPDTPLGLPMGADNEALKYGQIKSAVAKIAARYNITARWTGIAYLGKFSRSNVLDRRISSPARYYGADFGLEAALEISKDNATNAVYEMLANRAGIIHNDPDNIDRALDIYMRYRHIVQYQPIQCSIAVFYPLEAEQYQCFYEEGMTESDKQQETPPRKPMNAFYDECEVIRGLCDFEVADSLMIADGFLTGMKDMIIPARCPVPADTAASIAQWIQEGGRLWIHKDKIPWVLDTGLPLIDFVKDKIREISDTNKIKGEIEIVEEWPDFEPYHTLSSLHDGAYITLHDGMYSFFQPLSGEIDILPLCPSPR